MSDPFEPPASQPARPGSTGLQLAVAVVFAVPAIPCAMALHVLLSLRDICAPISPAMGPLFTFFVVGGPLLAALLGVRGFFGLRPVQDHWFGRLALGLIVAGATIVALLWTAEVARAWVEGANLAQIIEIWRNAAPSSLTVAAIGAATTGWVPALGLEPIVRRLRRS